MTAAKMDGVKLMAASVSAALQLLPAADGMCLALWQVVHVCAEHKKPAKLLKHLHSIQVQLPVLSQASTQPNAPCWQAYSRSIPN